MYRFPKILKHRAPRLLIRALALVWKASPGWTVCSALLVLVQGVVPLISLYLAKMLVDGVIAAVAGHHEKAALPHLLLLVGFTGAAALLITILDSASQLVTETQAQLVGDHMASLVHAKAIEIDLDYYESSEYHDALHRAQQEAPTRPIRIVRGFMQLGQTGSGLVGIVWLLASLHWAFAIILFLAAVPAAIARVRYSRELFCLQQQVTAGERKSHYYNCLLTYGPFAKELRLFGLGRFFMSRYSEIRQTLRADRLRLLSRRCVRDSAAQSLGVVGISALYVLLVVQVLRGAATVGGLVMYSQAIQRGQTLLQSLFGTLVSLYEDSLFVADVYGFLELEPKVAEPEKPTPVPRPMQAGIVFDHVTFRYPRTSRPVLQDVCLRIRPGEVIALVGENGSGKTTLAKLLCRLYDPTEGTIRLDGTDLRQFGTAALRREMAVVFQDYVTYHLTARENIWLGNLALKRDDERIREAARQSGADEVIGRLPQGYETPLGKWLEDGEELSIGQWQKVALARAFVREAQLIVLDEPSSALDPEAEARVFDGFRELIQGRAAVLISHRLSSVRMADRIYVLRDGRIVESGSHDDLVHCRGAYAGLFETQAQHYR